MQPDIPISEEIAGPGVARLNGNFACRKRPTRGSPDRLREALRACRALLVRNQTRVTADLIESAGRLEVIVRAGAGLDNIDVPAASRAGTPWPGSPIPFPRDRHPRHEYDPR